MEYRHSNVYVIRVSDTRRDGSTREWIAGPYVSTRADQTADQLEEIVRDQTADDAPLKDRRCTVEPLFSEDDCLRVADYGRAVEGSLY